GHNLLFDIQFLAGLGFAPGETRDTMLMSQVLHAGERGLKHTLDACCHRELSKMLDKEQQASDWSGTLTLDQLRYAATDAAVVRNLHDALSAKLKQEGLEAAALIENRALPAVAWMSRVGCPLDRQAWLDLEKAAERDVEQYREELDRT